MIEGFANIIICANVKTLQFVLNRVFRRHKNNRRFVSIGAQLLRKFKAINIGHCYIKNQQIRFAFFNHLHRATRTVQRLNFKTFFAQDKMYQRIGKPVIINNKYIHSLSCSSPFYRNAIIPLSIPLHMQKRLRTRRGGGWVVRGGDACVALVLIPRAFPFLPGQHKRPLPTSTPLPFYRGRYVWLRLGSRFVPVGAGAVLRGVGTLASPSSSSRERLLPLARATQASPLHPTPPRPLRIRFILSPKYLPV